MASHGNVLSALRQAIILQQLKPVVNGPPSLTLAFMPMHHCHGLHAYCFRSFIVPSRLVILPKWELERVLKAIEKYQIRALTLAPSHVHQFVTYPKISQTNLSSVLSAHYGAAYLPPNLRARFISCFPQKILLTEGYGLSETTVSALARPSPGSLGGWFKDNPDATGVLLPGMESHIIRDDGSDADYDEVGELWLKGPNIVPGYWRNPKATQETFVNGWLRTGDKFKVDKEQCFYFADRGKDILKVSGAQVSPMEIENVLLAHPQKLASDVTVAGVPGGRTDDEKVPRAWVVLSENGKSLGTTIAVQELEKWHRTNLSRYKWLRGGLEVVEEIPKSPTGKALRRVMQDRYEQQLKSSKARL